jgi:predicted nucleic acid-binding protein
MSSRIIADTSVWIEYFKNDAEITAVLDKLLPLGSVLLLGPVLSELLQGIRTKEEGTRLRQGLEAVPFIDLTRADWVLAGSLLFDLKKKGITIPLTDAVIAAAAIHRKIRIFTLDKHFLHIPGVDLLHRERMG